MKTTRRKREPFDDEDAIRAESVDRLLDRVDVWFKQRIAALRSSERDIDLLSVRWHRHRKTRGRTLAVPRGRIEEARRKHDDATVKKLNDNDRRRRDAALMRLETASQQVQAARAGLYDETVTKVEVGQHLLGVLHALTDVIERDAKRQRATAKAGSSNTTTGKRQPIYDNCVKKALELRQRDDEIRAIQTNWKRPAMMRAIRGLKKDELAALGFPDRLDAQNRMILADRLVGYLNRWFAKQTRPHRAIF